MKTVKREKSTSTRGHYVTNAQLLPAVIEAKQLNKVTDKLAGMIWMIAERYSRKFNFVGYSFREDMVSASVMNLCNTALKFDNEKYANPFAYYTSAIHNSFLQYIADEKKHRTVRDKLLIAAGANPSFSFSNGGDDNQEVIDSDNGYIPAPMTIDDDNEELDHLREKDDPDNPTPKVIKYRYEGRQPGETKVLRPGIDFTQDEEGNIVFLNSDEAGIKVDAVKPPKVKKPKAEPKPKTPRKKKTDAVEGE